MDNYGSEDMYVINVNISIKKPKGGIWIDLAIFLRGRRGEGG